MSKRFDNKRLFLVFGILAGILLLTFILKVPRENATLKESLVDLDTAEVFKIILSPKITTGEPFEFVREKNGWTVRQGNIISNPVEGGVQNIFSEIISIKPRSLAAVVESGWKEYELTDSLATRVKFLNKKGKKLADIMIGRFSYRQSENLYGYQGGNNIEGTSYVRINGEKEVYAVDGFLAFSFNGKFSDWRDKTLFRCRKEDILKVTFTFPGDSSYSLVKNESGWYAGEQKADSATVSNYLVSAGNINGGDIKDGFKPASDPLFQISFEGNNLLNALVKGYTTDSSDDLILNSTQNPEVYFTVKRSGVFSQIFKSRSYFLKNSN